MANTDIESLIRKFVENKASEEEIELLQEYFKTPIGLKYLDQIISEYASDFAKTHLVHAPRDPEDEIAAQDVNEVSFSGKRRTILSVAAAFIGMIMVAGIYFYTRQEILLTTHETVAGQKKSVTLPDNSVVILNGNSALSYSGHWEDEKLRSVTLSGEAYFKVAPNAEKPFVVNTSGISIKVVGTIFNVKSYDEDEIVETTLVEGKVIIEKEAEKNAVPERIELLPDQKAIFNKKAKQIVLEQVKSENEAGWVKGSLIFEDEPFSEIVNDLERWFDAKIYVEDKASLQCRFNTRIDNESLEEVLKLFCSGGNARYHIRNGNQVSIEGSVCNQKTE